MPRTTLGAWLHLVAVVNCLGLTRVTVFEDTRRGHNPETSRCTSTCRTQLSPPSGVLAVPSLNRYQIEARRRTDGYSTWHGKTNKTSGVSFGGTTTSLGETIPLGTRMARFLGLRVVRRRHHLEKSREEYLHVDSPTDTPLPL